MYIYVVFLVVEYCEKVEHVHGLMRTNWPGGNTELAESNIPSKLYIDKSPGTIMLSTIFSLYTVCFLKTVPFVTCGLRDR